MFESVNAVFGVTGSIATVKVVESAYELRRRGVSVRAVMTDTATGVIHPWTVEFATDDDAVTETIGRIEHVDLCGRDGWVDVLLVTPVMVSTVGKIVVTIDDSPVTTTATTALGVGVPVVVTPTMHEPVYDHPGVLDTIKRVQSRGVEFVDPHIERGKAKIATEEAIVTGVARATTDQTLAGTSVVITVDATTESIDPIRTLSNRASGRAGRAVVRALAVRGVDVTLVHNGDDTHYVDVLAVESAAEVLDAIKAAVDADTDALVSAAAISGFIVKTADQRVRSSEAHASGLELASKLIDTIRESHPDLPTVGFRAEMADDDEAITGEARRIMDRVGLILVVANDAPVMSDSETRVLVVRADETSEYVGLKGGLGARVVAGLATKLEK